AQISSLVGAGAPNRSLLHFFRNVQIASSVIVSAKFALQIRDQLAELLSLFGHYIGQQQAVEHAVAFRQITRIADASGLFAADQNFPLHHQVGNVLETDLSLVNLAPILGSDAVEHTRGIEPAHDVAGPLLAFEQP